MTGLIDPPRPDTGRADAAGRRWVRDSLAPLLTRLHFWVGLLVGPFLLVAAVTGMLYTLTPQLERVVHADQLVVTPRDRALPLSEQVAVALRAVPDGEITEIRPAGRPDTTTRVSFTTPTTPADRATTVFVDPYTGEVRGVLPTYGEWLPLRAWFDDLHRHLLLGETGRLYSELAASWLWVLVVSGLVMWVSRRRRRVRELVVPVRRGSPRVRLRSAHAVIGSAASVGLVFLSITGLTWSGHAGAHIGELRSQLSWVAPSVTTTLPGGTAAPVATDPAATAEVVERTARSAGLRGPLALSPSDDGGWTAAEVTRSWPVEADAVAVDPVSGELVDRVDFAEWPLMAKLARWGIDAHMGLLFGPVNQVALVALAAGLITVIVLGYRMWWRRVRLDRRPGDRAPAFAPPTTSRAVDARAVLLVAAVGVVTAVALPVLGASLLIMLAVDVSRSAVLGRRRPVDRRPTRR